MGAWLLGLGHAQGHHHQLSEAVFANLRMTVGSAPAATVAEIVQSTVEQQSQGVWANLVGWSVSLYAAAGLFSALQDAINTVWETSTEANQSWLVGVKERLVTFGMLWVLGLLLAVASGLTTLLTAFSGVIERIFPGSQSFLQFGNVTIFFVSCCAVFFVHLQIFAESTAVLE
jgi:membrane protein